MACFSSYILTNTSSPETIHLPLNPSKYRQFDLSITGHATMFSKALIVGALAASAVAQTTLNLFVDGSSNEKFVGSIVDAKCDATTIALRCTHGSFGDGIESTTCDPSATVSSASTAAFLATTLTRPLRSSPHTGQTATRSRQQQPKTVPPSRFSRLAPSPATLQPLPHHLYRHDHHQHHVCPISSHRAATLPPAPIRS